MIDRAELKRRNDELCARRAAQKAEHESAEAAKHAAAKANLQARLNRLPAATEENIEKYEAVKRRVGAGAGGDAIPSGKRQRGTKEGKQHAQKRPARSRQPVAACNQPSGKADRDASVAALKAARDEQSIQAAVSRLTWYDEHGGAKCPENQIAPPKDDMAKWLSDYPESDVAVTLTDRRGTWVIGSIHAGHIDNVVGYQPVLVLGTTDETGAWEADAWWGNLEDSHRLWLKACRAARATGAAEPRHPYAFLVSSWQRRPDALAAVHVTVTGNDSAMARRLQTDSMVRRAPWTLDAEITGAKVDGEPMAAPRPDLVDLFPLRRQRSRRRFKPGEQRMLPLDVVKPIPHDLRLLALQDVSADEKTRPALPGDVLTLLNFAHMADRPLLLTERQGAALLARGRDLKPRGVQPQYDYKRFWEAAARLRALLLFDPGGSGRWVEMATVEVPNVNPVDRVIIGPPKWARPMRGKWTLTAEGSAASQSRVTSGQQGLAGRIVTGIEYRLASGYSGRSGTVAPDLRSANRRREVGPGPVVELDWRTSLSLGGDWWDPTDPARDNAARSRFNRAVATLEKRGYFVGDAPFAEAPAGDSVEIVDRVRGGRSRSAGLQVRASPRFVEAARLAQEPEGAGFERMLLTTWAGIPHTLGL